MRGEKYQYALIISGILVTVLFGMFWYRELFPEYKIYQNDYVALEQFRSSYTGKPPPDFKYGVKQIVMEREDKGPAVVDRCISCHVALQFPAFSPTKLQEDINGKIVFDNDGRPVQVPNEDYVWALLDSEIAKLTDPQTNAQLEQEGKWAEVKRRLSTALDYQALKTAQVDDHIYDVTKVLRMHPLMGRETRPFEFHPIEEFGCTSCHNGNGRGLTTEKAHGPVFEGQYEEEFRGPVPKFTERDAANDPLFASEFNAKPGHELLFQTTPIYVGALMQSKCMNCHQSSAGALQSAAGATNALAERRERKAAAVHSSVESAKNALISLLELKASLQKVGFEETLEKLRTQSQDYTLPKDAMDAYKAQLTALSNEKEATANMWVDNQLNTLLGSPKLTQELFQQTSNSNGDLKPVVNAFLAKQENNPLATGSLFTKIDAYDLETEVLRHVKDTETSFEKTVSDQAVVNAMQTDVDELTRNYHRGQELYLSQACYACHRISGYARGGVGPELTRIGKSYPWYIKESIVWPQADLPTSTMPNYKMDHEDIEDIMTFLLAQIGERKAISETAYKVSIQDWEAGKKLPWEEPITPDRIHDLNYSMKVFATQGCAACHRLEGFESNVGYKVETESKTPNFDALYQERQWFASLFPEDIIGSQLVKVLEKHAADIDSRIVDNVRKGSIVEEIDKIVPGQVESLYTPFKYANRAKNSYYASLIGKEKDPKKKKELIQEHQAWKDRVHRVLMVFIQEYGFGRLICPRPNWSGVFRSDEWLMEHFHNPQGHSPRSLMPVFPFDDTKFYALTYMLDVLGKRNRDRLREVWENKGFNPAQTFQTLCSQCHGPYLLGNGPVAPWIYPIPKNLRNADFLRNLTKERVIQSITHGIKGTPMPPWGEVDDNKPLMNHIPVLTADEIKQLVDWLFGSLPGGGVIRGAQDVPKWNYTPKDVLKELENEGNELKGGVPGSLQPTSYLPNDKAPLMASVKPSAPTEIPVQDVFDKVVNPLVEPDKYAYYIKKKYYTEENIEQGKAFFEMNCAVCHGTEADGTGPRAGEMKESKPRMLTNLDWSNYRDDMRLLRSIKYGVPGTAMTPWGDLTSSLQRLQLVIFIRTLTQEHRLRENLFTALYTSFDHSILAVENARIHEYPALKKVQDQFDSLQEKRKRLFMEYEMNKTPSKESVDVYQQELAAVAELRKRQELDQALLELRNSIVKEKDVYQDLGINMLKFDSEDDFNAMLQVINSNEGRFEFADGVLQVHWDESNDKEREQEGHKIIDDINRRIADVNKEKVEEEGKITSAQRVEKLHKESEQIETLTKLRNKIVAGLEEAVRIRQRQKQLYQQYQSMAQDKQSKPEKTPEQVFSQDGKDKAG